MASRTLEMNNDFEDDPGHLKPQELDEDDMTEAVGSNRAKNEAPELEINVKWQLPGHFDATNAKRTVQALIANLLINHPNDVILIDQKQRAWCFNEKADEEKFTTECHQIAVTIHPIKNRQQQILRWVTITRCRTTSTLQEWKENDHFY